MREYSYKYSINTATFEREHVERLIYAFSAMLVHDCNYDDVDDSEDTLMHALFREPKIR